MHLKSCPPHHVFCCILLFNSGSAIALEGGRPKVAFSVPQSVQKPILKSGPAALASLYRKYDQEPPLVVQKAAAKNDGTISANPVQFDSAFLSPVKIGGQSLNLDFDTGSSDLWVYSAALNEESREGHSYYDPSISPTATMLKGQSFRVSYGDGSYAQGRVYSDTVEVGGTVAKFQAIEAAEQISDSFDLEPDTDGLLGLAFDNLNAVRPNKQKTFFGNVKSSLSSPLFTVDLKRGQTGSYDFGYIDDTKHLGSITYVPVTTGTTGYWRCNSNGYAINAGAFRADFNAVQIDAIIDTGSSLLLLPPSITLAYYSRVQNATYDEDQAGFIFPCSSTLPDIKFGFGPSYRALVPGYMVNYAPIDTEGNYCFGGIQVNAGLSFSVFGDVFIKSVFVVFDSNGPRIGFARKAL